MPYDPFNPMGDPVWGVAQNDGWIDQTVVGYIESLDAEGKANLQQNMRSQVNHRVAPPGSVDPQFPQDVSGWWVANVDQRMEQDLTLADGGLAFEASRQTLQMAFAADQIDYLTGVVPQSNTVNGRIGQLVTQDIEGWFYSCLNCDSTSNGVSHAFTPQTQNVTFMPYSNTWRDLPSISHGASGGNLSAYAQMPGQPGP